MKLTGKCKEAFEKWLLNWIKENIAWETETPRQEDVDHFYKFPFSMQWGVYLDFFKSVNMFVFVDRFMNYKNFHWLYFTIENENGVHLNNHVEDRIEENNINKIQSLSIKKANELYNNF